MWWLKFLRDLLFQHNIEKIKKMKTEEQTFLNAKKVNKNMGYSF